MSFMGKTIQTTLQSKILDFVLSELVYQQREKFQPLWSVDSWVKFLIWMTLNCGLSGEREDLELFAKALGDPLTIRMRRLFFERTVENFSIKLLADPADDYVVILSTNSSSFFDFSLIVQALDQVKLLSLVEQNQALWDRRDSLLVIPWNSKNTSS